ncbi:MAG: hypothetical protein GXP55_02785 [Deltaproteobacteria bacterium]|nr:hypothetical protein [Deltaproteobacteria bacterium]
MKILTKSLILFYAVVLLALPSMALALPSVASAQDANSGSNGDSTTYDFEDDVVSGDLVRPDGEMLNVRRRGQRASLIRIREHFIPEMLKSVEDL